MSKWMLGLSLFLLQGASMPAEAPKNLQGLYTQDGGTDYWCLLEKDGKLTGIASWGQFEMERKEGDVFVVKAWPDSQFKFEAGQGLTEIKVGKTAKHFSFSALNGGASPKAALEGAWKGKFDKSNLEVFLALTRTAKRILEIQMSIPAQGTMNKPMDATYLSQGVLAFQFQGVGFYVGALDKNGALQGRWFQGVPQEMAFQRQDKAPVFKASSRPGDFSKKASALLAPLTKEKWVPGLAFGSVHGKQRETKGLGRLGAGKKAPDADSEFEIGSITKIFTDLLALELAQEKLIDLDAPISCYLPKEVKVPSKGGHAITARHLMEHRSGLPRDPAFPGKWDARKGFEGYTLQDLFTGLSKVKLLDQPGAKMSYSNLGFGLLGAILERASGQTYEQLLQSRICGPLKMKDTSTVWSSTQLKRAAQGHNSEGEARQLWSWKDSPMLGCGSIHSTVNDMLNFSQGLATGQDPKLSAAAQTLAQGALLGHAGQTSGFNSYWVLDLKKGDAVIVLSNAATLVATQFSAGLLPLLQYGSSSKMDLAVEIKMKEAQLTRYTGTYEVPADLLEIQGQSKEFSEVTLTIDKGRLILHSKAGDEVNVFRPMSDHRFFERGTLDMIEAKDAADGSVTGFDLKVDLIGYQGFMKKTK